MILLPPVLQLSMMQSIQAGKRFTPQEFYELIRALYASPYAQQYIQYVDRLLTSVTPSIPLMYMNFKSHNVLQRESRSKMFAIVARYSPTTLCLSEALVPIALAHTTHRRNSSSVAVVALEDIDDDVIVQPFKSSLAFAEKKMKEYGGAPKTVRGVWKSFFLKQGYQYVVFASPADSPFGRNWGNCILTKMAVHNARALHLPSYGKMSFSAKESRCAVWVDLANGDSICTVHLDNLNDDRHIRFRQTRKLVERLQRRPFTRPHLTLCGDLNALHAPSYTTQEWKTLERLAHPAGTALPTDAVRMLNRSRIFRPARPLNAGQKFESLFQKCVTHVYSNRYKHAAMQFTDATDFDHQPVFVW